METKDFKCIIKVDAPISKAYDGIVQVNRWWTENLTGSSANTGDRFTVAFGETFVTIKVKSAVPSKSIVWSVADCYLPWLKDKYEWMGTDIIWELSGDDESAEISLIHLGLVPGIECYEACKQGWTGYVTGSLFKLITEGKGEPEKAVISRS